MNFLRTPRPSGETLGETIIGATSQELSQHFKGISYATLRWALYKLRRDGYVIDSDERRRGRNGAESVVYKVK